MRGTREACYWAGKDRTSRTHRTSVNNKKNGANAEAFALGLSKLS